MSKGEDQTGEIARIEPYEAVVEIGRARLDDEISEIFFAASSVQSFRDERHRSEFHWLWLGRYLTDEPGHAFVALRASHVCGYLVGSLLDPAQRTEFEELSYFYEFAPLTAQYPAHLHVNIDERSRSGGIGARLVERFACHAASAGVTGMHIVTGAGMRNVRFYEMLGFKEVARAPRKGLSVVMLARATR